MAAYFNSPSENCAVESGNCPAHPSWVLADDFDDGNWFASGNDIGLTLNGPYNGDPANDGWYGCNDEGPNNNCRNPPPPAVSPNGSGRGGTGYAAMSTMTGGVDGGGQLAMHGLYDNNSAYNELWIRFYIRFLSGYVSNANQKFFSLIRSAYQGGIDYGGVGGGYLLEMPACPHWTCALLDEGNIWQNQGNDIIMQPGSTWYFVEWHIKLNTFNVRNGIWKMWINDCGTLGNCTGSPTLRADYSNVGWKGLSIHDGNIGSMWLDIWGNEADSGTFYLDNLVVATSGPIGFIGASEPISQTRSWAQVVNQQVL